MELAVELAVELVELVELAELAVELELAPRLPIIPHRL